jgi:hypothetical protein
MQVEVALAKVMMEELEHLEQVVLVVVGKAEPEI